MAEITKALLVTGEEALINAGLELIARAYGCNEGNGAAEAVVTDAIKKFLRETAQAQAIKEAQEAAAEAAREQALAVLDGLTMTLQDYNG